MNFKNPDILSLGILSALLILALSIAYISYQAEPKGNIFQLEGSGFVFPYQLSSPGQLYYLPYELEEVSGLAWKGDDRILAVQDEKGIVFTYDLQQHAVTQRVKFGNDLDYEGIAQAGKKTFVLEQDGDIFEIDSLSGEAVLSKKHETQLSYRENAEGLAYDPFDNCLLIALKDGKLEKKNAMEGTKRLIYRFDLVEQQLSENPLYFIDQLELGRLIYKKDRSYTLKPSGIAVHPQTGHLYIIAAVGNILIVIDRGGKILYAERLNPKQLPQAEGIAFDPAGRLFIASEGKGSKGRLLVYDPKK